MFDAGVLTPIPHTLFASENVSEAFQAMQTLASAELTLLDAQVSHSLAQIKLHTAIGNPVGIR